MLIVILRTLIVYAALLVAMRLLGKRQMGEMELSEFVLASLIADLAAHPLQDMGIPLLNGLVPVITLFCCEVAIAGLSLRSVRLRQLLFGMPSILIREGRIDQRQMRLNRYTVDELLQTLRNQGYEDLRAIRWAILETNGKLSVIPQPGEKPVSAAQLGIRAQGGALPLIVVSDGRVLTQNLRSLSLTRDWLDAELRRRGLRAGDVFLMTADREGGITLTEKEARA